MSFKFNQDLSGAGNISNFTLYNSTIYAVSSLNNDIYTIEYDGDTGTFLPATILDVKLGTNGGYIASDDNYIWMTDGEKIYKLDPTDDTSTLTNSGILSDFKPFAITANSPDVLWVLSNNSSVCKFVSINKNDMTIQSPINTATPLLLLSDDTTFKLNFNVITSDSSNNGWIFYPTTHESQPKLRLSKFSSNGSLLLSTNVSNNSLLGHTESGFDKSAFGIATNNENVYAMYYDSIYKFNMNGNLISTLNPILNTEENLYGGLSITSKYLLTCIYNFYSSAENNYRVCFIDIDTFTFNKVVYIGSPCNNPSNCKTINADENNIFVNSRKFINGNYKEFISVLSLILKPGDLDNTFGTNGLVTTDFNGNGGIVSKMKIDSSNRIVVAGYSTINGYYDFALARYDNSGNLDSTFGTNGLVNTNFSGYADSAYEMQIDSLGRIIVAGSASINDSASFALARYIGSDVVTSNGSNNSVLCFKEDTKILCFVNDKEEYLPIQDIRRDTLVKTYSNGYKKVDIIGTKKMYNPGNNLKSKDRLYKCTKENYPEITEDLIITGCHSILTNHVTVEQRKLTEELMGNVYVTENHYRLPACVDDRAEPYTVGGLHNIWHIALEHSDYYMNYGIYANGLLVETTSKRMLKELSGMDLL